MRSGPWPQGPKKMMATDYPGPLKELVEGTEVSSLYPQPT